jgi:hypothetical protein
MQWYISSLIVLHPEIRIRQFQQTGTDFPKDLDTTTGTAENKFFKAIKGAEHQYLLYQSFRDGIGSILYFQALKNQNFFNDPGPTHYSEILTGTVFLTTGKQTCTVRSEHTII